MEKEEKKIGGIKIIGQITSHTKEPTAVFYNIELEHETEAWLIQHRYKEFYSLREELIQLFPDVPHLPGKSFFGLSAEGIEKRKKGLEDFLNYCLNDPRYLVTAQIRSFLELDRHVLSLQQFLPTRILSMKNEFFWGISQLIYEPEQNLLFTIENDMEASRDAQNTALNVSALRVFIRGGLGVNLTFKELITEKFMSPIGKALYSVDQYLLLLPIKGAVIFFRVTLDPSFYLDELTKLSNFTGMVTGIWLLPHLHLVMWVSDDKKFLGYNFRTYKPRFDINTPLVPSELCYEADNNRALVGTKTGKILIYDLRLDIPQEVCIIDPGNKSPIQTLIFAKELVSKIIIGYGNGEIVFQDLLPPGNEEMGEIVMSFNTCQMLKCLLWRPDRGQLIIGNNKGQIMFMNALAKDNNLDMIFVPHDMAVTAAIYIPTINCLVTASKEKIVNFWVLPKRWLAEVWKFAKK